MDMLGALPMKLNGNKFDIVTADKYLKLTRAVLASETTGLNAALTFIDNCIMFFDIPQLHLTGLRTAIVK